MAGADRSIDWPALIERFDRPDALALVLTGSFARGDAHPFSDVDLFRLWDGEAPPGGHPGAGSHLVDGRLVVVGDVGPADVEAAFTQPEIAVSRIPGWREGRALRDRDGNSARLQERARNFVWNGAMQARANAYASDQLVGWVEEVRKGLAGLARNDTGRLLDAVFGLSWGLNRLVEVQRGVLQGGGGDWFLRAERAVGPDTEWARLRRIAFGITSGVERAPRESSPRVTHAESGPTLCQRVEAGLRLYVATADLLHDALTPDAAPLIWDAVGLVRAYFS